MLQSRAKRALRVLVLGFVSFAMAGATSCGPQLIAFLAPRADQLSLAGAPVAFEIEAPAGASLAQLALTLDGAAVAPPDLALANGRVTGTLVGLAAGWHDLAADFALPEAQFSGSARFELAALTNPDECDVLNDVACLLPFPSSRFLTPARTRTGYRLQLPPAHLLPQFGGTAPNPSDYAQNDGFSPTAQVLMHFPGGIDPVLSDAPRIDPVTRTYGTRGLEADSPTLLIDAETGERINHFIENDSRARNKSRVLTFLRPGESLTPGRRYIVAVRNLVDASGAPVKAETAFAAIRDRRPARGRGAVRVGPRAPAVSLTRDSR